MKLSDWLYGPLRLAFCAALLFFAGAMPVLAQLDVNNQNNPNSPNFRRFPDFADLVEKASPAVVNIRTTEKVAVYQMPSNITPQDQAEFLRRFFGIPLPAQPNPSPLPKGNRQVGSRKNKIGGLVRVLSWTQMVIY